MIVHYKLEQLLCLNTMLDIKFIRENKELIQKAAKKKHIEFDVDRLVKVDEKRRVLLSQVEEKRAEQKVANNKIVKANSEERETILEKMKKLKTDLEAEEEKLKETMKEWQMLMLSVPNIPDSSVPDGGSEADNEEIKKWGDIPEFNFEPKSHIEVMTNLGMADFERGTKVAGFRGYFLKGSGAMLSFAIWRYALDFFLSRGLDFIVAPSLVRREPLLGTGFLPQSEDDLYKVQDGKYLSGTAEVATMGMYQDEVLEKNSLPKKILSFSPCFRREAGSHSKDVKGLIRVHEFFKVEQVVLCEASHEESVKWHEWLHRNTEEFIESLKIPYRTVINCGSDLGLGQVKKLDIELWVPLEHTYREIGSTSYFHDFQTRRLNIKYRDTGDKLKYAHSLNATAIATPRILVSLVENFQQTDGSVKIPDVLVPYMNGLSVIKK
ncbi:MAG: serine--tRNA ligase [Candidatus Zambryskibacteria bacterium]|nr:serine--tRNA ligase [Candidatus Zambryskibacteria bacterium]